MHDPLCVAFTIKRPWPKRVGGPATRRRYWPAIVTVWHREPGGHDAGEICRYRRMAWHVHHWRVQVHHLQRLRRWALTRCAWCGERHRKGDPISTSLQWDGPRGRWWRGEPGLYHRDCSSYATAHVTCSCADPICAEADSKGLPYGRCARCGKGRSFGRDDAWAARQRMLTAISQGRRDRATYDRYIAACEIANPEAVSDGR
jgi:hypothetical protein